MKPMCLNKLFSQENDLVTTQWNDNAIQASN